MGRITHGVSRKISGGETFSHLFGALPGMDKGQTASACVSALSVIGGAAWGCGSALPVVGGALLWVRVRQPAGVTGRRRWHRTAQGTGIPVLTTCHGPIRCHDLLCRTHRQPGNRLHQPLPDRCGPDLPNEAEPCQVRPYFGPSFCPSFAWLLRQQDACETGCTVSAVTAGAGRLAWAPWNLCPTPAGTTSAPNARFRCRKASCCCCCARTAWCRCCKALLRGCGWVLPSRLCIHNKGTTYQPLHGSQFQHMELQLA